MAQQTVNIGTVANDDTGDDLRTAFDKLNDNDTELYTDKVDTSDIVDDLTTGGTAVPLSAEQGKTLNTAKAALASPTFTGTPAAPTAATTTNTTQLATTAFVQQEITAQGLFTPAYGVMSVQGGSTAETTVDTTPRKITAWNTDGIDAGVTVDNTDDSILIATAGVYKVDASVSFTGTLSSTYDLEIYYYDNSLATWTASGFATASVLDGSGNDVSVAMTGFISLESNDKVVLYQSTADGSAMTVTEAQLSVLRIT